MTMRRSSTLLLTLLLLAGCAGGEGPPAETDGSTGLTAAPLLVLAAADLQNAFAEMVERYRSSGGGPVDLVFGSTGNLATQIEQGAPADLFFSANEAFLHGLLSAGLILPGSRTPYAVGRLALVWSDTAPPPTGFNDLLRNEYRIVAIANPDHAPYGVAARETLESAGVWSGIESRLVIGENVSQAYQFVRTGNADVGLVALSLLQEDTPREHILVPQAMHGPLLQVAGVLARTAQPDEAQRFLAFVMSPEGQTILRRYGFEEP